MNILVQGKRISYIKQGTGDKVLLLVHGWGSNAQKLSSLQSLFEESFTTIAIDLPGFGNSDMPEKEWSVPEYSSIIVEFLRLLNVTKCIYLGHSFGGALGVYIAANYPGVIDKLILCAPSFKRDLTLKDKKHWFLKAYDAINLPKIYTLKKIYYKTFYPESDVLRFPKLETNFKKIVTEDLTQYLKLIDKPTLIMWGDKDTFVPISNADILHNGIKNSKLIKYAGLGHGFTYTESEKVFNDVNQFLNI